MDASRFVRGLLDDQEDPQQPQYVQANDFPARTYGLLDQLLPDPYKAAGDAVKQYQGGDVLGAFETMFGGMPTTGALKVKAPAKVAGKAPAAGFDQAKMAVQYPDRLPGEAMVDAKTGKEYIGKVQSPEAAAVMKARAAAQKDINAGRYDPYFNVTDRFYVDANNYPLVGNTLTDAAPKKQETMDKFSALYNNDASRGRLEAAIQAAQGDPNAWHWYAMGQMEKEYVDRLGAEAGRAAFKKDFAQGMAATTGGMDPTSNYLMAHYGNFLREAGQPLPGAAHELHAPIGGRYATGNLSQYDKMINQDQGITAAANPKRFNFASNFMGHKNRATIDEQMTELIHPKSEGGKGLPQWYSPAEQAVHDVSSKMGIDPINGQELGWFGVKGVEGKPMIQVINEAIERTRRVTGMNPDRIMQGIVTRKMPVYGLAGLLGTGAMYGGDDQATAPTM
jgi:hypothetical protein